MLKTEGQTYANAAIGQHAEVLQDIHFPAKNIAIYQRDIDALATELARVAGKTVECRANGIVADVKSALDNFFGTHLPYCPLLLADVTELLALFEKTSQASDFRLLFTTVSTDMCRKFHTDINDLRLLCTYSGPGTLWLPDETVDAKARQASGSRREMIIDPQRIQQAQMGDVVILKGALYPDANPVLHRSPSIEAAGSRRLLLRIDTNATQNLWA